MLSLFVLLSTLTVAHPAFTLEDGDEILARERAIAAAMHARDRAALDALLAAGYVLRSSPDIDRDTWIRNALTLCWGRQSDISDFQARPVGDAAVASFVLTFYVDPVTCRPATLRSLITDVWAREDGEWRLAVRHAAPAPAPGAQLAAQFGLVPELPPTLDVRGEASFLAAAGNASARTLGFATDVAHQAGWSRTRGRVALLTTEADSVTRARSITASARQGARVRERLELFGRVEYARDRFAGIEHRAMAELGASFPLPLPPRHTLKVDAGLGFTSENRVAAEDLRFAVATGTFAYVWKIGPGTELRNDLSLTGDLESAANWRATNALAVTFVLNRLLSVKASQAVEYRHFPVPGFGRTDTRTAATLVVAFQQRPAR